MGVAYDFDGDGRAEIPLTGPSALALLRLAGTSVDLPVLAGNGTRFGQWLLNTADNRFEAVADFDGDGRAEIFIASPWGIAVLKQTGGTMTTIMMAPNGTRFGEWLLNTGDNRFGPAGDFDGDGVAEIMVSSPWGVGIFKLSGGTIAVPMMAPNGTRFGGWLLHTADNRFGPVGDIDGDGRAEILVSSPWGIGFFKLSAPTLLVPYMTPNGTRFGGWLLNTADNDFGPMADYNGDGRAEVLITSPWGFAILTFTGAGLNAPIMIANGTRIGGWLVSTLDNRFGPAGDYDGDRVPEILLVSPWGIGVLDFNAAAPSVNPMFPNGTQLGEWPLNTADDFFEFSGDYDGDGHAELAVTSGWGVGMLRVAGGAITSCATLDWTDPRVAALAPGI